MKTVPQLVQEFGALSAGEIADRMIREGYTGKCGRAFECVIAKYLRDQGHAVRVGVDAYQIHWRGSVEGAWDGEVYVPGSLRVFIENFDDNAYPELVDEQ